MNNPGPAVGGNRVVLKPEHYAPQRGHKTINAFQQGLLGPSLLGNQVRTIKLLSHRGEAGFCGDTQPRATLILRLVQLSEISNILNSDSR